MIAPRNRTLLPASSAASVGKLDIWLVIVLIARLGNHGATTADRATASSLASVELPRTNSMLLWRRWAVRVASPVVLSSTTAMEAEAAIITVVVSALSNLGSVVPLADLLLGLATTKMTVAVGTIMHLLLGQAAVVAVASPTAKIMVTAAAAMRRPGLLQRPLGAPDTDTVTMATTRTLLEWPLLVHMGTAQLLLRQDLLLA